MSGNAAITIDELRVKHFRAFKDASLALSDLTVLVGRNGAGKSTLMDAFEFIRDAVTDSLTFAVESRESLHSIRQRQSGKGAPYDVSVAIRMHAEDIPVVYGFRLSSDKKDELFVKEEVLQAGHSPGFFRTAAAFESSGPSLSPVLEPRSLVLPLLAGQVPLWTDILNGLRQVRSYRLSPSSIRQEPIIGSNSWLEKDGSNAGDVLKHVERNPQSVQWLVRYLQEVIPGISDVRAGAGGGRRYIHFNQGAGAKRIREFYSTEMSDGTLRLLAILLALKQEPRPVLTGLDEAEDSLHPYALSVLVDAMMASIRDDGTQIVMSTHSPEVLSHQEITPKRVRIIEWKDGESYIYTVADTVARALQPPENIGRLLRANALWSSNDPCTSPKDFWKLTA